MAYAPASKRAPAPSAAGALTPPDRAGSGAAGAARVDADMRRGSPSMRRSNAVPEMAPPEARITAAAGADCENPPRRPCMAHFPRRGGVEDRRSGPDAAEGEILDLQVLVDPVMAALDRKSTRLNSSHA